MNIVELARKGRDDIADLFDGQAIFVHFTARDAQHDHEILAGLGPDVGNRLAPEPQAVFGRAAIFVLAQVHPRVQELRGQMAVAGDDPGSVQTCRMQTPCVIAWLIERGITLKHSLGTAEGASATAIMPPRALMISRPG